MSYSVANLQMLSAYCDEFLIHGVDVEGKQVSSDSSFIIPMLVLLEYVYAY